MSKISVVITCVNGLPTIDECLNALESQSYETNREIIVLNCSGDGTSEHIKKNYPNIGLIDFTERISIPKLRSIGILQSNGDIVAVIEDHCIPTENWFKEIRNAHQLGYSVVGGAVENGSTTRLIDWSVFLLEYCQFMQPIPNGEVSDIAGNNASYDKKILNNIEELICGDYWEYFIHEELKKNGFRFLSMPTIVVLHKKEFNFIYYIYQRFHYSRSFASMRRKKINSVKLILYIMSTPLVPILLLMRIAREIFVKKRYYKEFLLSIPFLIVFTIIYSFGELIGYLLGAGQSVVKVE